MLNHQITVLPSAARTVTINGPVMENTEYLGVHLFLDISAASGTPTLDVKLQSHDPVSDKFVDMPNAAFAQKTGVGTDDLQLYPGNTVVANRRISVALPRFWRAVATVAGTTPSFTFLLTGNYILG